MNLDYVKRIADAVLYEGYILYPYRASAVKNQRRFNFGVLAPQSDGAPPYDAWSMRTQCLIEGGAPMFDVRIRFLHLLPREVYQFADPPGEFRRVPSLAINGETHHTWQEAIEREVVVEKLIASELAARPQRVAFGWEASQFTEILLDASGRAVGRVVRRQEFIRGRVSLSASAPQDGLTMLTVDIENTTSIDSDNLKRDEALLHSPVSTHTILTARRGEFISLFDPPSPATEAAAACTNIGTYPVLAGEDGARNVMLSSPIILYDYPEIAPESGGDFYDGTEIDEMLALRVMTLTDEEKHEMQQVDDRARQILERIESLPQEQWQKMHGAIRGLRFVQS